MPEESFSSLYEATDDALRDTLNVLKAMIAKAEWAFEKEVITGLLYLACERAEEAKEDLEELHAFWVENERKKAAPSTQTEGEE